MIQVRNYVRVAENELIRGATELGHQIDELRRQKTRIENDTRHKVHDMHSSMSQALSDMAHARDPQQRVRDEVVLFRLRSEIKHQEHDTVELERNIDRQIALKQAALNKMNETLSALRYLESNPALQ